MKILNGKVVAEKISKELKVKINLMNKRPSLTIVQVGNNPISNKYIKFKLLKAKSIGVKGIHIKLPNNIPEENLIQKIKDVSKSSDGLIVQLPLPPNLNKQKILNSIPYSKDVDGLSEGNTLITPATPNPPFLVIVPRGAPINIKTIQATGREYFL